MFEALTERLRQRTYRRRAERHLREFPDDRPITETIILSLGLGASAARDAFDLLLGKPSTDEEWLEHGPHWESLWAIITREL
jgi:hypothetical protein